MRVLFDQATPLPIRAYLEQHSVSTASQQGWDKLKNGDLLTAAENAGFEVFLTTDKNIRYQQDLTRRKIAIVRRDDGHAVVVSRQFAFREALQNLHFAHPQFCFRQPLATAINSLKHQITTREPSMDLTDDGQGNS